MCGKVSILASYLSLKWYMVKVSYFLKNFIKLASVSRIGNNMLQMMMQVHENKTLANGKITLSFIDIGKSCLNRKLFHIANVSFHVIRENKILAKISESTVMLCMLGIFTCFCRLLLFLFFSQN